jgi:hypothetical protein
MIQSCFCLVYKSALFDIIQALNETLAAGGDVSNGTAITSRMWGRTFVGTFVNHWWPSAMLNPFLPCNAALSLNSTSLIGYINKAFDIGIWENSSSVKLDGLNQDGQTRRLSLPTNTYPDGKSVIGHLVLADWVFHEWLRGEVKHQREREKVAHQQTLPDHRSLGYREAATWYSYYSSDMISSHISRSGREMWDENLLAHVIPERELQQVYGLQHLMDHCSFPSYF